MFTKFLAEHDPSEYHFRSDLFPTIEDRAFWEAYSSDEIIAKAEAELDYPWPIVKATDYIAFKESGDRLTMETVHFDRRQHLFLFAAAELKENKGRFLPQLVNGIFTICEESYWGVAAHAINRWVENFRIPTPAEPYFELFAAETAEHLAVIASILRKPLMTYCPEILDRIEYELRTRIRDPYVTRYDFNWMGYGIARINNWTPWILSNVATVFLLTEQDKRCKERAIRKMLFEMQKYYITIPSDGGCDEGTSYWGHAGASLFEFLYQLKCATDGKLDLFGNERVKHIAAYMKKAHIVSDTFINFADCHVTGRASLMPLLYGFARETKQPDLMNFAAAVWNEKRTAQSAVSYRYQNLRRAIYDAQFLHEMDRYPIRYPLHESYECLPDLQVGVIRAGNFALAAKGGTNDECHNHNDVGNFTLYDGTTPVLVDVGINTYSRVTFSSERYTIPWVRSVYHNLPTLNGVEQQNGAAFRADRFAVDQQSIHIDFANAYPSTAAVTSLTRTMMLSENGLILTDRFSFTGKAAVEEVLMSVLPVRVDGNTVVLDERYRITADDGQFRTEFVPFEDRLLESDWQCEGVTRIILSSDETTAVTITIEKL